jgi:hypothetical protein
VVDRRLAYSSQITQLRQQLQWLIDLERLLDPLKMPEQPPPTSQSVAEKVDRYLKDLLVQTTAGANEEAQTVAAHIEKTLRNHWWGLFQCYDVGGLPRTNNDLERYLRRIKMGQRRITGRKNVQDAIVRYGSHLAFVDYQEGLEGLLDRLKKVSQDDFLRERRSLDITLLREQKRHRFRYHREQLLKGLETRWETAINQIS